MKEFNFDFDSRFKEVGNQVFETTTNNFISIAKKLLNKFKQSNAFPS